MLVEDDPSIRVTLAELLADERILVTTAANGREALRELRSSAPPDLIVLDLMMPVMDGWEFRVEQRGDPTLAGIPIIVLSADISAKARAIAADAYVRKPIDFSDLLRQVRRVVEKAARDRLAAADRMAALGTLAAGIAHEINNPLTYVMANLQLLANQLGKPYDPAQAEELREVISDTLEGAERIRRIVKQAQLVAPVRHEERLKTIDLRSAIDSALQLTENQIRHCAQLTTDVTGEARVRGDRGRIEQLFMNLLLNAVQAIPEGHAADNEIRVSMRALPSDRVAIEIFDTGAGIPSEVQERVFQPFFSTKPIGQGTGLGLAICHGIVSALGGEIGFESAPGATTFRVVLPTTAAPVDDDTPPPHQTAAPITLRPRVLVIDDEPSILRVARQFLEPEHDVTTADSAAAAVDLIRGGHRFEIVLCELMLRGTTGMEMLDALERDHPQLAPKLLFMTAGAFTPRARQFLEGTRRPWLAKPFDRNQLIAFISAIAH